ncbi:MAG TPA: CoA-binding protein [Candidatus Eisenbacteria bacterium]|nr:CoA-binding protein [Candidatus Eisenbacteria bacterium]
MSLVVTDEDALAAIVRGAKRVAVIGMVDEQRSDRPAYTIPEMCRETGMEVVPVNPRIESSQGLKAYPDLASVPGTFDLVNVFRRSEDVPPHADEVLALPPERRPKVFWMQSGIRNDAAAAKLTAAGIQVVQDRCLGVYAARYRH